MALIRNTNRCEKILDNGFQSNCSSHAKVWTNPRYIEKRAEIRHRSVMLPALQLFLAKFRERLKSRVPESTSQLLLN